MNLVIYVRINRKESKQPFSRLIGTDIETCHGPSSPCQIPLRGRKIEKSMIFLLPFLALQYYNLIPILATSSAADNEQTDDYRVSLSTVPAALQAGINNSLVFSLMKKDVGAVAWSQLNKEGGRNMHCILVSSDMKVLGHVHTEDFYTMAPGNTSFAVNFAFPYSGEYGVGVELEVSGTIIKRVFRVNVANGDPLASKVDGNFARTVQTSTPLKFGHNMAYVAPIYVSVMQQKPADSRSFTTVLSLNPPVLSTNKCSTLTVTFTNSTTKQPLTDLALYLEHPMHLIIASNDLNFINHVHGVTGMNANGSSSDMCDEPVMGTMPIISNFGPSITAYANFSNPGNYTLYFETSQADHLLVAAFSVNVDGRTSTANLASSSRYHSEFSAALALMMSFIFGLF
jgi:hypothetical protein